MSDIRKFPCRETPQLDLGKPPAVASEGFLSTMAQGMWAEEKLMEALSEDGEFTGIRYGQSRYNHNLISSKEEWKRYINKVYSQMAKYGKRPDILILKKSDANGVPKDISEESEEKIYCIVFKSIAAVECRSSAYYYGKYIKAREKEGKDLSITVKEEDIERVKKWIMTYCDKPVIYLQIFFDKGFFITFDNILKLIEQKKKGIDVPGVRYEKVRRTGKNTYFIPMKYAQPALIAEESPKIEAISIESWDGRVYAIVRPVRGRYKLTDKFKETLRKIAGSH